jgi:hypothetical protein
LSHEPHPHPLPIRRAPSGDGATAPVLAVCLLILGYGLLSTRTWDSGLRRCRAGYGHARTVADTLAVDGRWSNAKQRISCGRLRMDGMMGDHPRTAER